MDNLQTTDYLMGMAVAMYVIKELFGIIKNKNKPVSNESELLHRQNMTTQHDKMIESLNASLAIAKSTNEKCGNMERDLILIKERTDK